MRDEILCCSSLVLRSIRCRALEIGTYRDKDFLTLAPVISLRPPFTPVWRFESRSLHHIKFTLVQHRAGRYTHTIQAIYLFSPTFPVFADCVHMIST